MKRRPDLKDVKLLIWPLTTTVGVVIADQVTKLWAVANLSERTPEPVLGTFLMFSLVYNEGGAMGTRLGPSGYYLVMALLVLPLVFYYIYRNRRAPTVALALSLIAGGAIGNLIDRIRLGRVVDFIDVDFIDISLGHFHLDRWWTFNIADAAISCAIVFLVVHLFLNRRSLDPSEPNTSGAEPNTPSSL